MVDNLKSWVKERKNEFANTIIAESGAAPDGKLSAVFMAGLPGSGKTELTKNLILASQLKVVRLDMDEIASMIEGYRPEEADKYRESASEILNRTFDVTLKRQLDFIMDGTFSSKYAVKNVERAFSHGYKIKIIYVVQDPKIAWDFTLAREKVEHRAIDVDGFIDSYFGTLKNIKSLMAKNKNYDKITLDMIFKDAENRVGDRLKNVGDGFVDKMVYKYYNREDLKEYICG